MRILELTDYSAGGCGVFARAIEESRLLAKKGHEVIIFSSNRVKGSREIAKSEDVLNGVKINRFPALKLGGESFMFWFGKRARNQALAFKPDVIIAHSYRHPHTTKALKLRKRLGCKVFLVTHAPFERSETRTLLSKLSVTLYDKFIGKRTLNKFDKVIVITKWEIPYLKKLHVPEEKIEYIPNGIREQFFTYKKSNEINKIIYTGRISPIKQIESLIQAIPYINDKKVIVEIFGPAEKDYLEKLKKIIKDKKLQNRFVITNKTYLIDEQIRKLDEARIFVLPSKTEGMPQALIEAMARGKIVLASDNLGSRDLIKDGRNGFIFKNGNAKDLADKINLVLKMSESKIDKIKKEARKSVEKFSWNRIINKLENIINNTNKRL